MKISYLRILLPAVFLSFFYYHGMAQETGVVQTRTADSIEVDDQLAEINYNEAIDYYTKGQFDSALRALNRTISAKSDFAEAFNNSGSVKYMLQDYIGALIDFNTALKLKSSAKTYFGRGLVRIALDSLKEAISDFDETIILEPNYAEAYYYRGGANFLLAEYQLAINDYTRAITLKNDRKCFINVGRILFSI